MLGDYCGVSYRTEHLRYFPWNVNEYRLNGLCLWVSRGTSLYSPIKATRELLHSDIQQVGPVFISRECAELWLSRSRRGLRDATRCLLQPADLSLAAPCTSYPLTPLVQNAPLFSICAVPISCLGLLVHVDHRDKWKQMIARSAVIVLNFYCRFGGICQKRAREGSHGRRGLGSRRRRLTPGSLTNVRAVVTGKSRIGSRWQINQELLQSILKHRFRSKLSCLKDFLYRMNF